MRRNEADDTPAALTELMDYIEDNTGLLGDESPGDAHFYIGGHTVKVACARNGFDHQSHLLDHIGNDDRLKLKSISVHTSITRDKPFPVLDVTTA